MLLNDTNIVAEPESNFVNADTFGREQAGERASEGRCPVRTIEINCLRISDMGELRPHWQAA